MTSTRDVKKIIGVESLHIQTTWSEEDMYLTILDGSNAWSGILDKQTFIGIDSRTEGSLGKSKEMAEEAFSGSSSKYEFSISDDFLIWSKVGGRAKINIAEIPLHATNFTEANDGILNHLIEENGLMKAHINHQNSFMLALAKRLNDACANKAAADTDEDGDD